jgi:hypothetical protein
MEFKVLDEDHGIYMWTDGKIKCIMSLYVDDLLIGCTDLDWLNDLKNRFKERFEMKDLGQARFLLGMVIERDLKNKKIYISQPNHINTLLEKSGMLNCNPVDSPMEDGIRLKKDMRPCAEGQNLPPYVADPEDCKRYQQILGSLNFIMMYTRPDIAFAVNTLSHFSKAPQSQHFAAIKRVVKYLASTKNHRLELGGNISNKKSNPLNLRGYVDADWGNCLDTRRSVTGYIFFLGDGPISWGSTRQKTVAISSCEAEYMAIANAVQEALALSSLLTSLGYLAKDDKISIRCDNKSAIDLAFISKSHRRTRHNDIKYHFTREKVKANKIDIPHVPSIDQLADILTKPLGKIKHKSLTERINIRAKK